MKVKGKLVALFFSLTVLGLYLLVRLPSPDPVEILSESDSLKRISPHVGKTSTNVAAPVVQASTHTDRIVAQYESELSESNSYQASSVESAKHVKTMDRLVQTRTSLASRLTADEGPLKTMKARHVERLLSKPVLETQTWNDPVSSDLIKATLVEDTDSQYRHFIIKQIQPKGQKESVSYVQIANHLLVRFTKEPTASELDEFSQRHNITINKKLLMPRAYLFEFAEVSIERLRDLEEAIAREPQVETFDANSLSYPSLVPNDPLFRNLWGLQNNGVDPLERMNFVQGTDISASRAWQDMTDCSSTIVAVMDTGIDPTHPDLTANVLANLGRNYTTANLNDFIDRQGHGTHVAGTIGAVGNNGVGISGVCWKAAIIPVKVLSDEGFGTSQMVIDGFTYISQTEAKVLNLSLGGGAPSNLEERAIAANTSRGKILVIAAGNENNNNDARPAYPASYPDPLIISVAAIHGGGDLASFSNFGANSVDIAAPGQDIVSTVPVALANNNAANAYQALSGTSMAAPHVAGAVALFWSYGPDLTAQQVKQEILDTADTGTFGKAIAGSRLLNLAKMMDIVKAKADFANLESGSTVVLRNARTYQLALSTIEKYSDIATIEIMHDDVVIGRANGSVENLSIELPLGYSQVELVAKVTDAQGRVYFSEPIDIAVDIDKILKFSEIDLAKFAGSVPCQLTKMDSEGKEVQLYKASVDSERTCQKLCEIIGPLAFSSVGEIACNSATAKLYNKSGGQTALGGNGL